VSRHRRAFLLIGLALILGGLAASDVSRREAEIDRELGPLADVVVARRDLAPGTRLTARLLALRRMPVRYAPADALTDPQDAIAARTAAGVAAGGYVTAGALAVPGEREEPLLRPGERVAEIVATGSPELVVPGTRVDVVVTHEGTGGAAGDTDLALRGVEVLDARPADPNGEPAQGGVQRVAASLRVTLGQAIYLAQAQSFAREIRLLVRAPGG
jgi:pilus assembly protein CpaB